VTTFSSTLGDVQRPRVIRVGIIPSWNRVLRSHFVQVRATARDVRHLIHDLVVVHRMRRRERCWATTAFRPVSPRDTQRGGEHPLVIAYALVGQEGIL
jgi:hypothetical protein